MWSEKKRSIYIKKALECSKMATLIDKKSISCCILRIMIILSDFVEKSTRLGKSAKLNIKIPMISDLKESIKEIDDVINVVKEVSKHPNDDYVEITIKEDEHEEEATHDPYYYVSSI